LIYFYIYTRKGVKIQQAAKISNFLKYGRRKQTDVAE